MIEIDGEFFEDPCELRKTERIVAIMETLVDTLSAQLKAEADNAPEIVIHCIKDMGAAQMGVIRAQPLWPPSFAAGGMIIGVDPAAPGGDRCFQGGVEL